jgi:endonuclease/exonuclease/phosphatase family metal-dependent hydrolase
MVRTIHCGLIGLALAAFLAFGSAPGQQGKKKPDGKAGPAGPRLRVLTYNIFSGQGTRDPRTKKGDGQSSKADLDRVAKVIGSFKPDVVALQEVDVKTKISGKVDQARELAELTGMHPVFGKAVEPKGGGQFGVAVLTKVKPTSTDVRKLPTKGTGGVLDPIAGGDTKSEPQARVALVVRVRPSKDLPDLTFVTTHMSSDLEENAANNRVQQAKMFNRDLGGSKGPPVVLAGDLNVKPGDKAHAEFAKAWNVSPAKNRFDFVLTRKADPWRVVETKLGDKSASDHAPLLTVLEWRGGKAGKGNIPKGP